MSENAEKRHQILQLLATGKITVDEATAMLSGESQDQPIVKNQPEAEGNVDDLIKLEPDPGLEYVRKSGDKRPSWLRIRVSDMKTGKNKVTVNVPMRLVRYGLSVGSRFAPELDELNWEEMSEFLDSERGMLVDVQDEEDGEHVQIFME